MSVARVGRFSTKRIIVAAHSMQQLFMGGR